MNINDKINEQALSWLMREKEGFSKEEKVLFEKFSSNIHNKKAYDKYKTLHSSCTFLKKEDKTKIQNSIKKDKRYFLQKKILSPIAASIVIVCFCTYFYYENTKSIYTNNYLTTNTKKVNITLPDNTLIDLDVHSSIEVNYYKNKRLINFPSGKALFSVAKDKNRPFIIRSGNTNIEVLGTKFELINIANLRQINVIEGFVKIAYKYNQKFKNLIILQKGQSFSFNNLGLNISLQDIKLQDIAKWKNDLIKFENTSLKEALKEFARYSNTNIILENYKVSQFKISGVFSIKELDKFIKALPEIYPLRIQRHKDIIKILPLL